MNPARRRRPRSRKADRRASWRELAVAEGGDLDEGRRPSQDRLLLRHGPWRIVVDTYTVSTGTVTVTVTRARSWYGGHRGLRVTVRRRNVFDRLVSALGFGSPLPVARDLLETCVVKGKPGPRAASLFSVGDLARAMTAEPHLRVVVKEASRKMRRHVGADTGVVVCEIQGVVTDVDRLAAMVALVRQLLDALVRVGEANEEEVDQT